jgi:hypothetical protein
MMRPVKRLTVSALKERGWTQGLITSFLREPDELRTNPFYSTAPPTRLYALDRIELAETTPEFVSAKAKAEERSSSMRAAATRRRHATTSHAERVVLKVPVIPLDRLERTVIGVHSKRASVVNFERPEGQFLERLMVNHLRHEMTRYDDELDALWRKVGAAEAKAIIRRKVYAAISKAYPSLAGECQRQLEERSYGW